jgi:hypothetical protein
MAHYAFLDKNNVVTLVIVGKDETDLTENWEQFYGDFHGQVCKRTSYNARIRKNFAAVGCTYDEKLDAFIAPKPGKNYVLDEETCIWQPIDFINAKDKFAKTVMAQRVVSNGTN